MPSHLKRKTHLSCYIHVPAVESSDLFQVSIILFNLRILNWTHRGRLFSHCFLCFGDFSCQLILSSLFWLLCSLFLSSLNQWIWLFHTHNAMTQLIGNQIYFNQCCNSLLNNPLVKSWSLKPNVCTQVVEIFWVPFFNQRLPDVVYLYARTFNCLILQCCSVSIISTSFHRPAILNFNASETLPLNVQPSLHLVSFFFYSMWKLHEMKWNTIFGHVRFQGRFGLEEISLMGWAAFEYCSDVILNLDTLNLSEYLLYVW